MCEVSHEVLYPEVHVSWNPKKSFGVVRLKAKLKPRLLIDMVQRTSEFSPTASLQGE